MTTIKEQGTELGTKQNWPLNEKIALWAIFLIVIYLVIAK